MKVLDYFLLILLGLYCNAYALELPLEDKTPGAIDKNIIQKNIHETICISGYTKTIRPPSSYTNKIKREQLSTYYKEQGNAKSVEEDHLIPLTAGGNPTAVENLWPQQYLGKYNAIYKDSCEMASHSAICSGRISLGEAQAGFSKNWINYCIKLIGDVK